MKNICLIIDEMHPSIIPMLEKIGVEADYRPKITKDEVEGIIENYFGLILRSKIGIHKELLKKAKNLKFIARAGAGVDNINVEEVKERNIELINAPEGNMDALAEHTVAMILTLLNRIHISDREVKKGIWEREGNRGFELMGKCIALIGYGYMGRAVAKRLKAFSCNVLAYDKYLSGFSDECVKESGLEEIYERADLVSFHIPLTDETKRLVDFSYLKNFKKDFWLINTARGEILVLKDLVALMKEGRIKGAALDVLENEKLSTLTPEQKEAFNFLAQSDKVLMTPHVGGWTHESYVRINEVLVAKIRNVINS
ncbi:MAG: phosphoglycerate dehydrogenase [Cytophagaceae bacterium]|nr:phosphoglycerate dehydrogenase [Cytophagaceae bacterium]